MSIFAVLRTVNHSWYYLYFCCCCCFLTFFAFLIGSGFCQKAQSIFEEMNVRISTNPSWFLFLVKVVVTKHLTVHALWGQFLMCLILLFNGRCILVIKISEKQNPRKVQTEPTENRPEQGHFEFQCCSQTKSIFLWRNVIWFLEIKKMDLTLRRHWLLIVNTFT